MSGAPVYGEPVVGFRAWRVGEDGVLAGWTMSQAPWHPGVNEGKCLAGGGHGVPGRDCTCGIYALSDSEDYRLDARGHAVGSIAAWGEIEVHPDGFRAQFACITAIAFDERSSTAHLATLAAAAERYEVPLVHHTTLAGHARRHGRPIEWERIPVARPQTARPSEAPRFELGARGIAVDDHVWIELTAGAMLLGVTSPLAHEVAIGSAVHIPPAGASCAIGEQLALIGTGEDALIVRAPLDLDVVASNPRLDRDPDLVRTHPESDGWLVHAVASDWQHEHERILWGQHAATIYRAALTHDAQHEDPFHWQRPAWIERQPRARTPSEALAILAAENARPRFPDEQTVQREITRRLRGALADTQVRRRVFRARARLNLRLHHPDADLSIDLHDPLSDGQPEPAVEVTLYTDAETADAFLAGAIDIAAALRSGRIQTPTPHPCVLVIASVIKDLHAAYASQL